MSYRRLFVLVLVLFVGAAVRRTQPVSAGDEWQPISQEELKMTSVPEAPGAPAIYLYRQVDRKDLGRGNTEYNYLRIKILTEEGRKYGNVEIEYPRQQATISNIRARTIHPDGTILNFDGKVYEQTIVKSKSSKFLAKTFSMPDVQVGSIIEYHFNYDFEDGYVYSSQWILSEELFTKKAVFTLKPSERLPVQWNWPAGLPLGTEPPKQGPDRLVRMTAVNVAAFKVEDYMPPENELKFRVNFVYSEDAFESNEDKYWKSFGKKQYGRVESFVDKRKAMEEAVGGIVSASDAPEVKLQKIYARCQQVRNLSYEPRRIGEEEKRDKLKSIDNVDELWKKAYGTGYDITWLFLALARAAGFEAHPALVASRAEYFFNPKRMNSKELEANVVEVKLNGKDLFFDPGAAFTPYGLLPWAETGVQGRRLDKDGGSWIQTPLPESSVSRIERKADMKLTDDGSLEGKVTVTYTGLEAYALRMEERNEDDTARKKLLEDRMKEQVPAAIDLELKKQPDWKNANEPFVVEYEVKVSGWVSGAGKRALLPVGLFSETEKHMFEHASRVFPVYFAFPFQKIDEVNVELPLGWQVGSVPKPVDQDAKAVQYTLKAEGNNSSLHFKRALRSDLFMVPAEQYSVLRTFYQLVRSGDEQQIALNREPHPLINKWLPRPRPIAMLFAMFAVMIFPAAIRLDAADAPAWMHALVSAPLPKHDEKTDAVLLYSEEILNVQPNGKIKETDRAAYKILRPDGRRFGKLHFAFTPDSKITSLHAWCIPAQGKDYEVKEKDATERGYSDVEGGELYTDLRAKIMEIPAAEPGNIVGFEIEHDDRPYILQDEWFLQQRVPVAEARYTLQLPPGWEFKAVWLNHEEIQPTPSGNNQWQWEAKDLPAIRWEPDMPPWKGVAGLMIVSLVPPGGTKRGFLSWSDMGSWYNDLTQGRREASPDIKQEVAALTASASTSLDKMRALADFLQRDIRYVAISLGIGGVQPHPATEVFKHRFGDCKDKATLLSSMLKEIGVDSYYVIINTERGGVTPATPPHIGGFNHAILAIRLPDGVSDSSLVAIVQHPKLGRLLFFDPTDELTPFGQLHGGLQANYGMLVTPDGGDLLRLPELPPAINGIQRSAQLKLSANGTLSGDVREVRIGDHASSQRWALRAATKDADKIKPIETVLSGSLGTFQITKATVGNLQKTDLPFVYNYSVVAQNYAKTAGDLLLVRPRVVGNKSSDVLETKEPRKYSVEFEGPSRDTDTFEIALPAGYEVDDLPPPVNADYSFASYHSKTEVNGNTLKYTRTFEVKELSVPLSKVEDLKKLYRVIAGDERNTAVLKPATH